MGAPTMRSDRNADTCRRFLHPRDDGKAETRSRSASLSCHFVRQCVPPIVVDNQFALQWRYGTLVAIPAFANPAGYSDRLKALDVRKIEAIGIHDFARVADFAAKRYRKATDWCTERFPGRRDLPGKAEIPDSIRCLGELPQELSGSLEGAVHVPQRACAAITRELKWSCRMALRDRASLIDPDKEKRDALGPRSLQS